MLASDSYMHFLEAKVHTAFSMDLRNIDKDLDYTLHMPQSIRY